MRDCVRVCKSKRDIKSQLYICLFNNEIIYYAFSLFTLLRNNFLKGAVRFSCVGEAETLPEKAVFISRKFYLVFLLNQTPNDDLKMPNK